MSERNRLALRFLGIGKKKKEEPLVEASSIFDLKEMPIDDIEKMRSLFEIDQSMAADEEALREDFRELVTITQEVRGVQKQAIILLGERIHKVRDIFKKYGAEKGGFSRWLDYAFTSRKTAYNMLAFYELHESLPSVELKEQLKRMPAKASYILASRSGHSFVKEEIIREYRGEKQQEMLDKIQEKLPIAESDNRSQKDVGKKTLDEMERLLNLLDRKMGTVHATEKERMEKMILRLRTLVDTFF